MKFQTNVREKKGRILVCCFAFFRRVYEQGLNDLSNSRLSTLWYCKFDLTNQTRQGEEHDSCLLLLPEECLNKLCMMFETADYQTQQLVVSTSLVYYFGWLLG